MDIIVLEKDFIPQSNAPIIATLGQFDGLHHAHKVLIETTVALAKSKGYKSAVVTFDPHPDFVLKKQEQLTYLTPLDIKKKVIKSLGIDYLFIVKFVDEVAQLSHQSFVEHYLLALGIKEVVVGFDFRYGYKGLGNVNTLETDSLKKIKVHVISEIKYQDEKLGSSLIRDLLSKGRVDEVKNILGRFYELEGTVISGQHLGRKLNVPTANLAIRSDYAIVKTGVYATIVTIDDKRHIGICNFGHNPTFNYQTIRRLEVHIIDFSGDLYGKKLKIAFIKRLRDEKKFSSILEFQDQIEEDRLQTIEVVQPIINEEGYGKN